MKLLETLYPYIESCHNQPKFIEDIIIITRLMTHVKVIQRVKNRKCGYDKNWLFLWFTVYDKRRQFVFC